MATGKKLFKTHGLAGGLTTLWHKQCPYERHCDTSRLKGLRKVTNRSLRRRLKKEMLSEINEILN